MRKRAAAFAFVLLFSWFSFAFAGWDKKPEFRWTQLYRYDIRQDNHQLYNNRISAAFNYLDSQQKQLFEITPFFEIRRNIDKGLTERKEAGLEIGKDIAPWMYLGEGFQYVWIKEDYLFYGDYEKNGFAEAETRLMFSHTLLDKAYLKLKGFVLEEYTYDFDQGAGMRNEVAIGFIVPIGKYVEAGVNWRHIDRVTYYDSDTCEATVTLVF